uniref:Allograft inflammatory factor 1-like n=1 Tax=Eptatretus burgeri TaxID=7764 RepID=A0A8C4WZZ9_EPTBU
MELGVPNEGIMGLKIAMENLGVPKTYLELKTIMKEVAKGKSNSVSYRDFLTIMLGKRSATSKLVTMFEGKASEGETKAPGVPPKRDLSSLP